MPQSQKSLLQNYNIEKKNGQNQLSEILSVFRFTHIFSNSKYRTSNVSCTENVNKLLVQTNWLHSQFAKLINVFYNKIPFYTVICVYLYQTNTAPASLLPNSTSVHTFATWHCWNSLFLTFWILKSCSA